MKTRLTGPLRILNTGGGLGLLLALALIVSVALPVLAVQIPPFTAEGHATICNAPLPIGTQISARIGGVEYGTGTVTQADGFYHVVVQGDDPDTNSIKEGGENGDLVEFFIMGKPVGQAVFESLGLEPDLDLNVTLLDLSVTSDGCCPIAVEYDTVSDIVPAGGTETYLDIPCGTEVQLTSENSSCCTFNSWDIDGAVFLDNPHTLTMSNFHTVTANCTINEYTLTVNASPPEGGTVTVEPEQDTYTCGTSVNITAAANPGWLFTEWSGDLSGTTNPVTIIMDSNKNIAANFISESEEFTLTIIIVGNGDVTIDPDQPTYAYGTEVDLNAVADPGWTFSEWSGDLTGTANPTSIIMNGDRTVTATFTQDQYTLTINVVGSGTVTRDPNQPTYTYGTEVDLTANPGPGFNFTGWSGDLTGSDNPATITMNSNKIVTATFMEGPSYTLTVNVVGSGTVTKNPDQATYAPGSNVDLTANPALGWSFSAWSGDLTGSTNPTSIIMDGNKAVTATFTQNQYTLTINVVGSGTVVKDPNQATYTYGTVVNLTANPGPGFSFTGWSGDLTGSTNPTSINMNGNKTVTATFVPEGLVYNLIVHVSGGGSVAAPGTGLFQYPPGTVVPLSAVAQPGYDFLGWVGGIGTVADPSATNTTITMNGDYEITASFSAGTVDLDVGWNTFSTPIALDPSCDTWGELTVMAELDYQIAYYYNGSIFIIVPPDYPIQPCDAILVKMLSPGAVVIKPNLNATSPPSKQVLRGWNLIGSAFLNEEGEMAVPYALVSLYHAPGELSPWGYTQIISPPYNQPSWVYIRDGTVQFMMLVGKGYWVAMENADQYNGQTVTPWFFP